MQRRLPMKTAIDTGADSVTEQRKRGGLAVVIARHIDRDPHLLTSFNDFILNKFKNHSRQRKDLNLDEHQVSL